MLLNVVQEKSLDTVLTAMNALFSVGVEQGAPGANITTASDAIWYTIVTISTVGYGDQYSVTDAAGPTQ